MDPDAQFLNIIQVRSNIICLKGWIIQDAFITSSLMKYQWDVNIDIFIFLLIKAPS